MGKFNLGGLFGGGKKPENGGSGKGAGSKLDDPSYFDPRTIKPADIKYCVEITNAPTNGVAHFQATRTIMRLTGQDYDWAAYLIQNMPIVFMSDLDRGDAEFVRDRAKESSIVTVIHNVSEIRNLKATPGLIYKIYEGEVAVSTPLVGTEGGMVSVTTTGGETSAAVTGTYMVRMGMGNRSVSLDEIGPNKVKVIKEVKDMTGWGLKESKAAVDKAPNVFLKNVTQKDAEYAKKRLEGVGAKAGIH